MPYNFNCANWSNASKYPSQPVENLKENVYINIFLDSKQVDLNLDMLIDQLAQLKLQGIH